MAKDNMFLGMARGKVGDIVFYRQDGKQISRTRNRAPRNPRSQKQLVQRAVMATVGLSYKFGSAIFDHAFQGKSKGAECQREFMSTNSLKLRSLLSAEVDSSSLVVQGRVVSPKSIAPVPFGGMMISRGTYDQSLFSFTDGIGDALTIASMPSTLSSEETSAEYSSRVGLIPGDLYTFVIFPITSSSPIFRVRNYSGWGGVQYPAGFNFVRMRVKDLSDVQTPAENLTYSDVFVIEATNINTAALRALRVDSDVDMSVLYGVGFDSMGGFGIIRSRDDSDLRSTSYLHLAGNNNAFGITAPLVLAAWEQGAAEVVGSDLILEGGNFIGGSIPVPSVSAISFEEDQNQNAEGATFGNYIVMANMSNGDKLIVAKIAQRREASKSYFCLYSFGQSPTQPEPDNGILYQVLSEEFEWSDYSQYGDMSAITSIPEFIALVSASPASADFFPEWLNAQGAKGFEEADAAVAEVNALGGRQYQISQ